MKGKTLQIRLTVRDLELFKTLSQGPKTIEQLLRHSCRYHQVCDSYESLRRRLGLLAESRLISVFRYYAPNAAMTNYYKLTRTTYRLLFPESELPGDAFFNETKFGSQIHTHALHQFLSFLDEDAYECGYEVSHVIPDGQIAIDTGEQKLIPDCTFQLIGHRQTLNYYVELDCGTEPVNSSKNRESLARKIRNYDRWSKLAQDPFRVLFVFTSSLERMNHFLDLVYQIMAPPFTRSLFLGTMLKGASSRRNLVCDTVFQNHAKRPVALGLKYRRKKTREKSLVAQ